MILWTHKMIAEQVYERVTVSRGRRLDRAAFIRGNLLPDISSRYRKLSHDTKSCWPLMESIAEDMDGLLCGTARGSERMGVICHFISDFFCSVHNTPFAEPMTLMNHLIYEHRLHGVFRQLLRSGVSTLWELNEDSTVHFDSGQHWMAEGLSARHRVYAGKGLSMELDIREALGACVAYCGMMIDLEERQMSVFSTAFTA